MKNSEKKQELWEKLKSNYSHLENYCTIELRGILDEEIYFHPTFIIDEETKITTQSDINNNNIYAANFSSTSGTKTFSIEIYADLILNIIIGYHTNKETVMLALDTLYKVREHSRNIETYINDYVNNILIGASVKEITNSFINELKTTSSVVEFIQNKLK